MTERPPQTRAQLSRERGAAPRPADHPKDPSQAPRDLRIERAMKLVKHASVTGVKLHARTWSRHPAHHWHGPPITHDRALLLVGGFAGSTGFYNLLVRSFEAAGARRVAVMPPVDNAFADIRVSAERLASMVRLLGGDVDIIGHSEGGLVARWYAKELGGDEFVRHLVTIGSPNRGLPVRIEDYPWLERSATARRLNKVVDAVANRTVLPMASVALRQMLRGSEFMETLGSHVPPGRTEYLAIRSRWDGVVPFSAADLEPASNVANVSLRGGPRTANHSAIASTNVEAFETTMTFIRRP